MSEILRLLTDASPLVVVLFAFMWLVNRVCLTISTWRGDPKFERLGKSIDRLSEEMVRQSKSSQTSYTRESGKITEALKNLEAVTINHSVVHDRCAFVNQMAQGDNKSEALPLKVQRTLLEYQWKWCRDLFIRIISQSIKNNGITGNESGIATRVVNALYRAAEDSKHSIERVPGVDEYQYTPLYERDIPDMIHMMWEKAVPLYYRQFLGSLDTALDDFGIWITQLFEDRLNNWFLQQEDPDTGRLYNRDEPAACTGQFQLSQELAERLKAHGTGQESSDDLKPSTLVKKR